MQGYLGQVIDGEGTVTSYVYSDRNLLTQETSEVAGVTDYAYTDSGEPETKTDARGITETRFYDALDRVTAVDYPDDTLDISHVYDDPLVPFSLGRLTSIERGGHSIVYRYDRFGRILRDGELTFGYDRNGNRVKLGYPGNVVATYSFDYADREASLTVDDGGGAQAVVTSASYLPSGPLDGLALGNGFTETRPYDSRYYPAAIVLDDSAVDVLSWLYTTDAVGNPTSIADLLDSSNNRTYGYQDYQYFLDQSNGPWGTLAWSYDRIGNRLTESRDGGAADDYQYVPNTAGGNSPQLDLIQLGIGGVHDFTFDAAGNQIQSNLAGNVIDRSFDDAGRMSRQERTAANASSEFLYDGRSFLRRSEGQSPYPMGKAIFCDGFESGDTSGWGAGGGSLCLERLVTEPVYSSSGLLHHNGETAVLYFAGRPVGQLRDANLGLLTTDHLGTPIALTGSSVEWSGEFDPFGEGYSSALENNVFLRFPGQWNDRSWISSGLGGEAYYNVHRWYSRQQGRYLRADPLTMVSEEPYIYTGVRPTHAVDPLGLYSVIGPGRESIERAIKILKNRLKDRPNGECSPCKRFFDDLGLVPAMLEPNGYSPRIYTSRSPVPCVVACYGAYTISSDWIWIDRRLAEGTKPKQIQCLAAKLAHELAHYLAFAHGKEGPEGKEAEETCFGRVISGVSSCGF